MVKRKHWISARGCVYNVNYHFVWSVKYRLQVLVGDVAEQLRELHESIAQEWGFLLHEQEIMPDHVHLFITDPFRTAPSP